MQGLIGILCHNTSQVTAEFLCALGLGKLADFGDLDWFQVGSRPGGWFGCAGCAGCLSPSTPSIVRTGGNGLHLRGTVRR